MERVHAMELALALEDLAAASSPFLIGVRHHSVALAAAVPALLEDAAPDRIFVELPADFQPWLPWLGHAETEAPVALAASRPGREGAFYPFADFSPELAAVRWAVARGVPVEAFDLPMGVDCPRGPAEEGGEDEGLIERLQADQGAPDGFSLWDRLVEAAAVGGAPEATRRAALLYGAALRWDAGPRTPRRDRLREAYMRARLRDAGAARPAVVVGAFHAPALLEGPALLEARAAGLDPVPRVVDIPPAGAAPVTSLISYRFDLFDARSGYPAGVLDPGWQQRVWEAASTGGAMGPVVAAALVGVCRALRALRHVAGPADAAEAYRLAYGLAALRALPAPGRRELLEALEATLGQGELLGRGRALARALERTLVGSRRGRLARQTPVCGLLPSVEALLRGLRLPGPDDEVEKLLRLDPLRSDLDRRRHVTLQRLCALEVPYAILADQGDFEERLTHAWRVKWEPATEASIALAGLFGADLEAAVSGQLERGRPGVEAAGSGPAGADEEAPTAQAELAWVERAAECGLPALTTRGLDRLSGEFSLRAKLGELVSAVTFVDRLARGHIAGLLREGSAAGVPGALPAFELPAEALLALEGELLAVGVRALDGLHGSSDPADARALTGLVRLARREGRAEDGRLGQAVEALARGGAPLISGAAEVALLRLGRRSAASLGLPLGAEIEAAATEAARRALSGRLAGVMLAAGPLVEAEPALQDGLCAPIEGLCDADFLDRLAALRGGFHGLSPASRERLLRSLAERVGEAPGADPLRPDPLGADNLRPEALASYAVADAAGRERLGALGLLPDRIPDLGSPSLALRPRSPHALGPLTRWRLVLGQRLPPDAGEAARYAHALDELYGGGAGEGSRAELGGGGGLERAFPTARGWADEVGALFGAELREEVIGRAAEAGDVHALLLADPDTVSPSVELLERALSLQGGLSEGQLEHLRALCRRVTEALVQALSLRVRPALGGLCSPRPTRRRTDRLHLRRTVEANLRTAEQGPEGWRIVPERLHFRARSRREMDWHIVLVVDTSGSMEASVIYAAMMAAILAALPAVHVSFYAFSDTVIDFTERVADPLALLLEVKVGGGTRIHRALRYAREQMRVPSRSLLLLITDFEEGGSVAALQAEVRALAESGVKLLGLAALGDDAKPRYCEPIARRVVAAGMPVAALSPLELARWVGEQLRG